MGCLLPLSFLAPLWLSAENPSERGIHFSKKVYTQAPLPTFSGSKERLPSPILEGNPEWVDLYWKCWELAFDHLRQPAEGSPFVSNYVDEAFDNNLFQWDTIFMVMFWRYAWGVFPGIESLDNFYCRQHADGFISREIRESGPDAGMDRHPPESGVAINPPLFSWAEVEHYRVSGDRKRFAMVLPVLEKYVDWLERNRVKPEAKHGLFWQTNFGSGMDNTPQAGSAWVEMSAQMVRQYDDLALIAESLGKADKATAFRQRAQGIASRMNELMWDECAGMYWNLNDDNSWNKCLTIGFSWTLMAGVVPENQAARLVQHLMNEDTFYRLIPFATLSATDHRFDPRGDYWLGSSWAPTNYEIIKGMIRYGFDEEAALATEKYLTGMSAVYEDTGTIWENYAPDHFERGSRSRPEFVGWSGCGPIALLIENVLGFRPDAPSNRIIWHLRRADRHGVEQLRIGDATISITAEARSSVNHPATVTIDNQSHHEFSIRILHPMETLEREFPPGTTTLVIGQSCQE